ncbi:hypothetical protein [Erythrobacter dokdonensis]|uniref:DUF4156 domain-containing protein n=1 Tax=Erythrobacter dokdonensis DSW-74 TaxID=1300349 RepID=A0A1A7BIE6_9SPHN|nr:hypothetical protein [Erythrobacter dokdonensis]OBV12249.1 hypothetical protein I603_0380 [Erythrobacter dokdonensis DSW-74]
MLGLTFAALALLAQTSEIVWRDAETVEVTVTFAAKDRGNPFPQGTALLKARAAEACGDKGTPAAQGEPVVTGIAMAGGKPQVSMSGVYACRKS